MNGVSIVQGSKFISYVMGYIDRVTDQSSTSEMRREQAACEEERIGELFPEIYNKVLASAGKLPEGMVEPYGYPVRVDYYRYLDLDESYAKELRLPYDEPAFEWAVGMDLIDANFSRVLGRGSFEDVHDCRQWMQKLAINREKSNATTDAQKAAIKEAEDAIAAEDVSNRKVMQGLDKAYDLIPYDQYETRFKEMERNGLKAMVTAVTKYSNGEDTYYELLHDMYGVDYIHGITGDRGTEVLFKAEQNGHRLSDAEVVSYLQDEDKLRRLCQCYTVENWNTAVLHARPMDKMFGAKVNPQPSVTESNLPAYSLVNSKKGVPYVRGTASIGSGDKAETKEVYFKQTYGQHTFSDDEIQALLRGDEISIETRSGNGVHLKLGETEVRGHKYVGPLKTDRGMRRDLGDDRSGAQVETETQYD